MKCPKCNAEMESGYIQGGSPLLIWTPKKHKLSIHPRKDGKDILLCKNYISATGTEAHCCRECGFIITPIPSGEERWR
jgi:hypothetical protein